MTEKNTFRRLLMQPLVWVLLYGSLILYGAYAYWKIPVEVLPRFNFPEISIITHQAGATASELETQITWPLEGEVMALPNLVDVRSSMGDGTVETDIRFQEGTDPEQDLMAVNGTINRARAEIPPSAQPIAEIMGQAINEVADYSLQIPAEDAPADVQRAILANVVPALRALPGVYRVEVYGTGDEALWVQPNLAAMYRYGVPITAIVDALQQQVLLSPGGYLTQGHQDVFIEVRSLPGHIRDLEQVPVASANGPVPLQNLARIVRAPVPTLSAALLDRRPSVALTVFKQPDASTVPVNQSVQTTLTESLKELPPGVKWVSIYDQGHLVHSVGADLGRNLLIGGALAVAVLLWVLGAGRGIWILALSIPLSLLLGIAGTVCVRPEPQPNDTGSFDGRGRFAE
jgi:cobalt-zinc-cadmium resistance protein CzcA